MAKKVTFDDFVKNAPTEFMECRVFAHSWDPSSGNVVRERRTVKWTVPCSRCGAQKTFVLSTAGVLYRGSNYKLPEGYLIIGGVNKKERGRIRLTLMDILLEEQ